MVSVSIITPTFRRPEALMRCIASVQAQRVDPSWRLEHVVVDNEKDAPRREAVEAAAEGAGVPIRYVHEPQSGVSSARNAAYAAASGEVFAHLDDDQEAPPEWLAALVGTLMETGADAAFGPYEVEPPDGVHPGLANVLRKLGSRLGASQDGWLDHPVGLSNSAIRRAALPSAQPFQAAHNEIGGEDDVLFAAMAQRGARFAWSARANVTESLSAARATWRYVRLRAFANGQGATQAAAHRGLAGAPKVAMWMAVGAVQATGFAALAGLALATGRDQTAHVLKMYEGMGKIAWPERLAPRLYGDHPHSIV